MTTVMNLQLLAVVKVAEEKPWIYEVLPEHIRYHPGRLYSK
jgi:hypothetical protein